MSEVNDVQLEVTRLAGRVSVIESRLSAAEDWIEESRKFHVEMRKNWDSFTGAQVAVEKLQAARHAENATRLSNTQTRIAVFGTIIALLGLVCAICMAYLAIKSANHSEADPAKYFHSEAAPQVYAGVDYPQHASRF